MKRCCVFMFWAHFKYSFSEDMIFFFSHLLLPSLKMLSLRPSTPVFSDAGEALSPSGIGLVITS